MTFAQPAREPHAGPLSRARRALTAKWRGIRGCQSISVVGDTVCGLGTKPMQGLTGLFLPEILRRSRYDKSPL